MLSWKTLSLIVAAVVAMNGVVGVEQGYGGGVWTTAPSTNGPDDSPVQFSTESSIATDNESKDDSESIENDDSVGSDVDSGSQVDGSWAIDEGSASQPGTVRPPSSSGDGSCDLPPIPSGSIDFPGSGSIDFPPFPSGSIDFPHPPFGSGSADFPPSTTGSGSIEFPPLPSGSDEVPNNGGISLPSSAEGSDRDSSTTYDDSTAGEASMGSNGGHTPPTGGCKVRTRRLRH
ncbi:Hypothetical protein PHPALM_18894 [Phytophthora palmivora]|uniref:Uncharacterized protein n=1 Tax=Phytophthora palmivora TaxID=4796 RepID=A0A2P4XIM7_9STRA|nr:Hypothetical protein PHPALM_18894 [Phytophthora palmivora]